MLIRPRRRRLARHPRLEPLENRALLAGLDGLQIPWVGEAGAQEEPASPSIGARNVPDRSAATLLATSAASLGLTGAGQTVAVIDTGVAYDHRALGGGFGPGKRVVGGWDFAEGDANPYDDAPAGFHGTHVAGLLISDDPGHPGIVPGADLVALRVFDDLGNGSMEEVEEALRWVIDNRTAFRYPITAVNLSLGAGWNGRTVPSWANLEDELAELARAGVLVVAAAGNAFAEVRTPGLDYPAASPYVLPVGSIGADGQLSEFSQRDVRMIAAPGERLTSTVPDDLLDRDGVPDDWLALSGTSMAAPIVTGAGVLVQDAYRRFEGVFPEVSWVVDVLRDSGDPLYDKATSQTYTALRLDRALAQILPEDEAGSNRQEALDLGVLAQEGTQEGATESLGDADWFRFRVARAGRLALELRSDLDDWSGEIAVYDAHGRRVDAGAGRDTFVVPGQDYFVAVESSGSLGRYDWSWRVTPAAWLDEGVLHVADGGQAVAWTLTLGETIGVTAASGATPEGAGDAGGAWRADEVREVVLHASGTDDRLVVRGTPSDETFRGTFDRWELQSESVTVRGGRLEEVVVWSGGGRDDVGRLQATGDARGILEATGEQATWTDGTRTITLHGMDRLYVSATVGDEARLRGTSGSDTVRYDGKWLRLFGPGYHVAVRGFGQVTIDAGSGWDDVVRIDGTPDDATYEGTPTSGTWRSPSAQWDFVGFDRYYVSGGGGWDVARLIGGAGNEVFRGSPGMSAMKGEGFYHRVQGFDWVHVDGGTGADDVVRWEGSADADTFRASGRRAQMASRQGVLTAENVDRIYARAGEGDTALFAPRDRSWRSGNRPDGAFLRDGGTYHAAIGFAALTWRTGDDRANESWLEELDQLLSNWPAPLRADTTEG